MKLHQNAAQVLEVIGFDIDDEKIENLKKGINREFKADDRGKITFTSDRSEIRRADFVIIAVPTPVTGKAHHIGYQKGSSHR